MGKNRKKSIASKSYYISEETKTSPGSTDANELILFSAFFQSFMQHFIQISENSQFSEFPIYFQESEKMFDYLCNRAVSLFFLPIFHENFKFLKSCPYDFHKILHSHSTPKGAPSCSKASKSYDWNVRNMAKISPKMTKKLPFFDSFRLFSQKLSIRFEQNFIQSLYTILGSYMCNGIKIVWLRCETHKPKLTQKWPKNSHFSTFFDFCKNSPYDSNESVSEGKRLKPTPLPHMRLWFCLNKTFSTHLSINMFELTVFL